jgi:hypothetical protein
MSKEKEMQIKNIVCQIEEKLYTSSSSFDDFITSDLFYQNQWLEFQNEVNQAYIDENDEGLYALHLLLNKIYAVVTTVPKAGALTSEGSHSLARIKLILENSFISDLNRNIETFIPAEIPNEGFFSWLREYVDSHPVADHSAYTSYLADKATAADLRCYLVQESAIDASTDDFLASLLIGSPASAKMEIAANFWDEMGEGEDSQLHTQLFDNALNAFDISADETSDALTLDALVCGNLQTMLSQRRELFYQGVGYFAATEQLVPDRFIALKKGWERVGLPEEAAQYHLLHIEVDGHHTDRWYSKVIAPLAQGSEAAQRLMLLGALYRIVTSERYLNGLLKLFSSKSK